MNRKCFWFDHKWSEPRRTVDDDVEKGITREVWSALFYGYYGYDTYRICLRCKKMQWKNPNNCGGWIDA